MSAQIVDGTFEVLFAAADKLPPLRFDCGDAWVKFPEDGSVVISLDPIGDELFGEYVFLS